MSSTTSKADGLSAKKHSDDAHGGGHGAHGGAHGAGQGGQSPSDDSDPLPSNEVLRRKDLDGFETKMKIFQAQLEMFETKFEHAMSRFATKLQGVEVAQESQGKDLKQQMNAVESNVSKELEEWESRTSEMLAKAEAKVESFDSRINDIAGIARSALDKELEHMKKVTISDNETFWFLHPFLSCHDVRQLAVVS